MKPLAPAAVDRPSKQRTRVSCRSHVERLFQPGTPSKHGIKSIDEAKPGGILLPLCRESDPKQKEALPHQVQFVEGVVIGKGCIALPSVAMVRSCHRSKNPTNREHSFIALMTAVQEAKRLSANGIVVESVSRVLRHDAWRAAKEPDEEQPESGWRRAKKRDHSHLQPTDDDLREVIKILDGVQLYTIAHPDASQNEQRKVAGDRRAAVSPYKRGRKAKRPNAGWTADEQIEQILALWSEGVAKKAIARQLDMPISTVRSIIKRHS